MGDPRPCACRRVPFFSLSQNLPRAGAESLGDYLAEHCFALLKSAVVPDDIVLGEGPDGLAGRQGAGENPHRATCWCFAGVCGHGREWLDANERGLAAVYPNAFFPELEFRLRQPAFAVCFRVVNRAGLSRQPVIAVFLERVTATPVTPNVAPRCGFHNEYLRCHGRFCLWFLVW